MIRQLRRSLSYLCLFCFLVSVAQAEEAEEATQSPEAKYLDLKPSFVANFGNSDGKRLKFIKADVTIRAFAQSSIDTVMAHEALVRHQIVMLLSAQTEESLATSEGQEALRLSLLENVNAVLKEETGKEQIDDLLFTSFVVQR